MAEDEVKVLLESLAEFHASNYHVMQTHPGGKDCYLAKYKMLKEVKPMNPAMQKMWQKNIEKLVDTFSMIG